MTIFEPFLCINCGGEVRLIAMAGRKRIVAKGKEKFIPAAFELPTCVRCGETYMDEEVSNKLEEDIEYKEGKICECRLCVRRRRINALAEKIPEDVRKEFNHIMNDITMELYDTSMSLDVLRSKIEDQWPNESDGKYIEIINGERYEVIGKKYE